MNVCYTPLMRNTYLKKLPYIFIIGIALAAFYAFLGNCPIRMISGIPGPACGMTRAVIALFTLNFCASFYYHPLAIPALILIVFLLCKNSLNISKRAKDIVLITSGIIAFIVYLVRIIFFSIP